MAMETMATTSAATQSNESGDRRALYGNCTVVSERYEKLGRLGEGTYGIVYKARDLWQNKTAQATNRSTTNNTGIVALKRCIPHHQASDGFPLTTLREIQTLRYCAGHPHIVKLHEIAVSRNGVFLVFEYWYVDKRCFWLLANQKSSKNIHGLTKYIVLSK